MYRVSREVWLYMTIAGAILGAVDAILNLGWKLGIPLDVLMVAAAFIVGRFLKAHPTKLSRPDLGVGSGRAVLVMTAVILASYTRLLPDGPADLGFLFSTVLLAYVSKIDPPKWMKRLRDQAKKVAGFRFTRPVMGGV